MQKSSAAGFKPFTLLGRKRLDSNLPTYFIGFVICHFASAKWQSRRIRLSFAIGECDALPFR